MKFLTLLFSVVTFGQQLHHEMISSQGTSTTTSDGFIILQTIGQQSTVGTSNGYYVVMQGFQQNLWSTYIASNKIDEVDGIKIISYPNPFVTVVNFQFSKSIFNLIHINIFDIAGRLIYEEKKVAINSLLTLDLSTLPTAEYLVRLNNSQFNYYTKIIKK